MRQDDSQPVTDALSILVRVLGLVVLLVGLYIGIKVIVEAWTLYEQPQKIERFAGAIAEALNQGEAGSGSQEAETIAGFDSEKLTAQVSYFIAWFLVLLLMMVIGGLASSAIRTGGQLVLYDLQAKRFASQLIREARQGRGPADRALRERDYE